MTSMRLVAAAGIVLLFCSPADGVDSCAEHGDCATEVELKQNVHLLQKKLEMVVGPAAEMASTALGEVESGEAEAALSRDQRSLMQDKNVTAVERVSQYSHIVLGQKDKIMTSSVARMKDFDDVVSAFTDCTGCASSCGMNQDGITASSMTNFQAKLTAISAAANANGASWAGSFDDFVGFWSDITIEAEAAVAFGDFTGSWMLGTVSLSSVQAGVGFNNMFITPDSTSWGAVGMYFDIPCPASEVVGSTETLKVSFIYNDCNSGANFMVSMDPSILACYIGLGTSNPVIEAAEEVVGAISELTFGISQNALFEKTVKVCHGANGEAEIESLTMAGHIAVGLSVEIDLGKLLDVSALEGILSGGVSVDILVLFEGDTSKATAGLTYLTSMQGLTDMGSILETFLSSGLAATQSAVVTHRRRGGTEWTTRRRGTTTSHTDLEAGMEDVVAGLGSATFAVEMSGFLTFNLADLTNNILPDLSFTLGQQWAVLKTSAASASNSGTVSDLGPGFYTYMEIDASGHVEIFIASIMDQIDGVLSVIGIDISEGITYPEKTAGIGWYFSSDGFGIQIKATVGGTSIEFKCFFVFSSSKFKCNFGSNWAEVFLEAAKYVLAKIDDFAENGYEEVSEWSVATFNSYSTTLADGTKTVGTIAKNTYEVGKKTFAKTACRLGFSLTKCNKYGGTPSNCGDGTEYVIMNDNDKCMGPSSDCYGSTWNSGCKPTIITCTHTSSSWETQMISFWFMTSDMKLCSEYLGQHAFSEIEDPDNNPRCLKWSGGVVSFATEASASRVSIIKKDTTRFKIKIESDDVACFHAGENSELLIGTSSLGRRRFCDKTQTKIWRIYQKLEPASGTKYEKENGDSQFNTCV